MAVAYLVERGFRAALIRAEMLERLQSCRHRLVSSHRIAKRCADHLLCASSPALVLVRVRNGDRQIVRTSIVAVLRTGRAPRPIVTGTPVHRVDMIQNAKFPVLRVVGRQFYLFFFIPQGIYGGYASGRYDSQNSNAMYWAGIEERTCSQV